jgi:thiamine biosynthesis lipoprotein
MGTVLEITLESDDPALAHAALDACFARALALEAIFTTWNDDSELMRLNRAAGGPAREVSPELGRILRDAVRWAGTTEGAFDPTVGPLVALWRDARLSGRMPPSERIDAMKSTVGYEAIEVGHRKARLARPGMAVDLGGFAKGWALDRLGELLAERGIERALLDFGQSSMLGMGQPSDAPAWRVLVRDPHGGYAGVLSLHDQSLSVSEALGESALVEGHRLGHVIDPRSGRPLDRRTGAVVVAPSGAAAEAWSKALLVLVPERALELLAEAKATEAMLMEPTRIRATPGFVDAVDFVVGGGAEPGRAAEPPGQPDPSS